MSGAAAGYSQHAKAGVRHRGGDFSASALGQFSVFGVRFSAKAKKKAPRSPQGLGAFAENRKRKTPELANFLHRFGQRRPFLVEALVLDLAELAVTDLEFLGDDLVGLADIRHTVLRDHE